MNCRTKTNQMFPQLFKYVRDLIIVCLNFIHLLLLITIESEMVLNILLHTANKNYKTHQIHTNT